MKISSPKKNISTQLWKIYFQKIHQENTREPRTVTSQKFWKNYETLIQQSKKLQKKSHSKPTTLAPLKGNYDHIFLNYWNGVSCTVTYHQQIPSQEITEEIETKTSTYELKAPMLSIALFACLFWFTHEFFFIFVGYLTTMGFLLSQQSEFKTRTKVIPGYTIHYMYQINPNHLIFTQIDNQSEQTIRLEYYKVKSLKVEESELRLKSLYHRSFKDRAKAENIKATFCIPVNMPQGKVITDFLREILQLNKAKRST